LKQLSSVIQVDAQERLAKALDKFESKLRQVDIGLKGYRLYKRRFSASSNISKLNFNNSNNKFPP
jgi:CDP-diacylglycerol pyrophosphatase